MGAKIKMEKKVKPKKKKIISDHRTTEELIAAIARAGKPPRRMYK